MESAAECDLGKKQALASKLLGHVLHGFAELQKLVLLSALHLGGLDKN